ncbi:hypothetical protein A1Q2_03638 [Trichosporon asahii var. asahii CBS 8904]|uniref:Uncharacterized protein n=1 Tax=Trichosporon asahii var. asahii (strain CBS 8904) TaxID=1220162 RepID=K1VN61_TRIAC|nr:hypothetical protein A1Q2_03638 [Trichosporon asahii var. asahii CBS 8904]
MCTAQHPREKHSEDEYEPVVFPRNEWPTRTYYFPGIFEFGGLGRRVRFAAQQASRRVAQGIENGALDGFADELDLNLAVLDVVLELAQQIMTTTVEEWRDWLRDATQDVLTTAQETLTECDLAPCSVLERWPDAPAVSDIVICCMEQVWCGRDSREALSDPAPRSAVLALVERYGPTELEKAMVWYGRTMDPDIDDSSSHIAVNWEGTRIPVP